MPQDDGTAAARAGTARPRLGRRDPGPLPRRRDRRRRRDCPVGDRAAASIGAVSVTAARTPVRSSRSTSTASRSQVRTWGDPAGRPLVFWHPLGDVTSGAYLTELAPTLTAAGLRLVAPDGPGFGGSPALPPEEYAVPRLAGLVWGLAAALGLDRPVLMGHSWGGVVTLAAAAERPRDVSAAGPARQRSVRLRRPGGTHPEWSLEERADAIAAEPADVRRPRRPAASGAGRPPPAADRGLRRGPRSGDARVRRTVP